MSNTKPAYQFDLAGIFVGVTDADESPLEPDVFHLPAGCTFSAPPEEWLDAQWPRWNGSSWDLVTKPTPANDNQDPVAKLQAFLNANPDVAQLLQSNDGGANV